MVRVADMVEEVLHPNSRSAREEQGWKSLYRWVPQYLAAPAVRYCPHLKVQVQPPSHLCSSFVDEPTSYITLIATLGKP